MKNKKMLSVLLSFSLFFGAVGCVHTQADSVKKASVSIPAKNNNLKKEQVLSNVQKNLSNMKSVTSNYKISVKQLDKNKKAKADIAKYDIFSKIIYSGKDKDNYSEISQMYNKNIITEHGKTSKTASYVNKSKNKAYYDDGSGLKEYKGTELVSQSESSYVEVAKAFILVNTAEHIKNNTLVMKENKDTYDFIFKGKNGNLFYAIDGLFGLGIELMDLGDADIDVTYQISKKDFNIKKVVHSVIQSSKGISYKSVGEYDVTGINDINKISEVSNIK